MRKEISFDELKELLLYRKIVAWDAEHIELDTGLKLRVEMTDWDCCARVESKFSEVKLDAAITAVSDIEYEPWEDYDTYGCKARVTIMHNRNAICMIESNADGGNGGYYFSIASFIVTLPVNAAEGNVSSLGATTAGSMCNRDYAEDGRCGDGRPAGRSAGRQGG